MATIWLVCEQRNTLQNLTYCGDRQGAIEWATAHLGGNVEVKGNYFDTEVTNGQATLYVSEFGVD